MSICSHYAKNDIERRCENRVSAKDPEKRYCGIHRRCEYPTQDKLQIHPKFGDLKHYYTFMVSIIDKA